MTEQGEGLGFKGACQMMTEEWRSVLHAVTTGKLAEVCKGSTEVRGSLFCKCCNCPQSHLQRCVLKSASPLCVKVKEICPKKEVRW